MFLLRHKHRPTIRKTNATTGMGGRISSLQRLLEKRWLHTVLYFWILFGFGLYTYKPYLRDTSGIYGDGGIIQYSIIRNIQNLRRLDFTNWTDRRIFYPHKNTLAYTDHYYVHSLIGLPYYLVTADPIDTSNFISCVQLLIAISGYYLLARKVSGSTTGIILSGLYFVYLPAFFQKHAHINLYGFTPWFVFFVIQFVQKREVKYLYLSGLAFLLQALVGVYLQLFMFMITPVFLLALAIHLQRAGLLREIFPPKKIMHLIIVLATVGATVLLVNLPYLKFKETVGAVRSLGAQKAGSADLASYLAPAPRQGLYLLPEPFKKHMSRMREGLFLGVVGVVTLLASLLAAPILLFSRTVAKNNKYILYLCLLCLL
ncbi:MAG TPA: hypothetical protein VJ044_11990, partial [Candidatus Hodarchaeales archaeon]|nr:hypothetical protein [Candidatus Hodarchaeales archaeon]